MYLNIGAQVRFRDGIGGTLHKVVVDPQTRDVTDLVIVRGLLQRHDYVLPMYVVEQASEDEIVVALYTQELVSYPQYREVEFEEPVGDWEHEMFYPSEHVLVWNPMIGLVEEPRRIVPVIRHRLPKGIPFGEEVIGRSSVVCNIDGVVGKIDHLWLDRESWEVTHLVVRRGIVPHYFVIPFSWVSTITPQEIFIQGTDMQLKEVPSTQLQIMLGYDTPINVGDEGHLLNEKLVIADEVLDALAEDPRTASSVIEVIYDQGVITLIGEVESELAHGAAEEIAHRHRGVMSVVNALEVRPGPSNLETMAMALGQLANQAVGATTAVDHVSSTL
jgi:uncharacterized protein YrrD